MEKKQPITLMLMAGLLVIALAGCQSARNEPTPTPTVVESAAEESSPTETPAADPTATVTPSPSPTPDVPDGWDTYRSDELSLSLYYPAEWEPLTTSADKIDIRGADGSAWVEIHIVDETNADEWGIGYTPGMLTEDLIEILLAASREDGDFEVDQPLLTRTEATARVTTGSYHVFDEMILIGVIGLPDRAIVLVGHNAEPIGPTDDGAEPPEQSWARLEPLYEQVLWSITPVE
ncbi:MAG: hypothetical protein JXJ17_05285 [Anaerolineae bacterium]|nr:hypothetical protein [Anaerolineae bacterium]